jgi:hypothetical protein
MTETGTMSAKGSILTDCDSLLYTGVSKEIFFTLVKLMKIENTSSFYNLMLNSEKKIVLCATKKINILTLVLFEKKNSERNKNHTS